MERALRSDDTPVKLQCPDKAELVKQGQYCSFDAGQTMINGGLRAPLHLGVILCTSKVFTSHVGLVFTRKSYLAGKKKEGLALQSNRWYL